MIWSERDIARLLRRLVAERVGLSDEEIGETEPFLELGLNSADAVGLTAALEEALGREVSPILVFDHPTIRSAALALASPANEDA